jgi:hypothetical protein
LGNASVAATADNAAIKTTPNPMPIPPARNEPPQVYEAPTRIANP